MLESDGSKASGQNDGPSIPSQEEVKQMDSEKPKTSHLEVKQASGVELTMLTSNDKETSPSFQVLSPEQKMEEKKDFLDVEHKMEEKKDFLDVDHKREEVDQDYLSGFEPSEASLGPDDDDLAFTGFSLNKPFVPAPVPDPYHWDQTLRRTGFIYWVINLYKSRRSEDKDFYLKNIEGELKPGEVCCILSPDKASKRFLKLVSGRSGAGVFYGEIRVGGDAKTGPIMKAGTSYLLDGQVLADFVTVEECLLYTTYFVRPESTTVSERNEMVEGIMKQLRIAHLRNRRIEGLCGRGISRSARVAVNIGNMLLERKRIIFMDRPAQGLDLIETEVTIATILEVATNDELTVFLSMENPTKALLDNFKKLLILADRQQLYFGNTTDVGQFFHDINHPLPEETSLYDHILDLIHDPGHDNYAGMTNGMTVRQAKLRHANNLLDDNRAFGDFRKDMQIKLQKILDEAWQKFVELQQDEENGVDLREEVERMRDMRDFLEVQGRVITPCVTSWFFQVRTLIKRKFKKIVRDPNAYVVEVVPIVGWLAIISFWFYNVGKTSRGYTPSDEVQALIDNRDIMDMTSRDVLVALFIALFGVQAFTLCGVSNAIKEVRLYKSEARSNLYSVSAYMASWVFMCIIEQALLIIPYSLCTFYFYGLYHGDTVFTVSTDVNLYTYYLSVLVLLATINNLFVYVFAYICNSATATLQCSIIIQAISTLFSGMVVPFPDSASFFKGLSLVSPMKFAFEGLVLEYSRISSKLDSTGSIASIYGINEEPYVENRFVAVVALGSFVGILFMIFVMAPSLDTYKCCSCSCC